MEFNLNDNEIIEIPELKGLTGSVVEMDDDLIHILLNKSIVVKVKTGDEPDLKFISVRWFLHPGELIIEQWIYAPDHRIIKFKTKGMKKKIWKNIKKLIKAVVEDTTKKAFENLED